MKTFQVTAIDPRNNLERVLGNIKAGSVKEARITAVSKFLGCIELGKEQLQVTKISRGGEIV